jgi:hypothetical protein
MSPLTKPIADVAQEEDPVRAMIRRMRAQPPMPEDERQRLLTLAAEADDDPKGWLTTEQIMETLARHPGRPR